MNKVALIFSNGNAWTAMATHGEQSSGPPKIKLENYCLRSTEFEHKKAAPAHEERRTRAAELSFRQSNYFAQAQAPATATATATVAPTIGLLPMPMKPIISTCAGTEEEPAN